MSLFPKAFQEISPLFRLIDDYERASGMLRREGFVDPRSFHPKFDVRELKDSYELHGELPGIEQKDINIEWSDSNTLTISGRTETHYEKGNPPAGRIEGEVTGKGHGYHEPTVEAEDKPAKDESTDTTVSTKEKAGEVSKPTNNEARYWVSERSVGEFHRSFNFPSRVDHDAVKAKLNNGILSIVVPKSKTPHARKVAIE
jgi:HSP20 family protein